MQPQDFDRVYAEHRAVVIAAILRCCPWASVEDLEQDVWLRFWKTMQPESRAQYDPARSRLTTFLWLITRSIGFNAGQKHAHDPVRGAAPLDPADAVAPSPEAGVVAGDLLAKFRAAAEAADDGGRLLDFYDRVMNGQRVDPADRERACALLRELGA